LVGGKSGGIFAFIFSLMTGLGLFYIETRFGAPTNLTPAEFIPNQDRLHQIGQFIIVSLSVISLFRFNLTVEVPTQGDLNHEPLCKRTPGLAVDIYLCCSLKIMK